MKEFIVKIYDVEEAFDETVRLFKADETIESDEYYQKIVEKLNSINESRNVDNMIDILCELWMEKEGYFKPIPECYRSEFDLDNGFWYVESHLFD